MLILVVLLLVLSGVVISVHVWFDAKFGVNNAFGIEIRLLMLMLYFLMLYSSKAYSDCTSGAVIIFSL